MGNCPHCSEELQYDYCLNCYWQEENMGEQHPENIDPPWFQELVRRAYHRKLTELVNGGINSELALEESMWYVFELRNNLTELYKAGGAQ